MLTDADTVTLDRDVLQYIAEVLKETDQDRERALREIRAWLKEEGSWLNARGESKFILPFLRGCKFDVDKTKKKLTNYYVMRRDRPEWFRNRNPRLQHIQDLIKMGVFLPLKRHHDNKLVVIVRIAAHDPKKYDWNDIFKVGKMILDVVCMEDQRAQIYGVIAIFDLSGLSFGHYRTITPSLMKNAVYAWQNYHIRPKNLEFVSSPIYINVAINLIKSFMTEKMKQRIKVHFGGTEKAQDIVDKDILPVEFGGENETVEELGEYWLEKLLRYEQWFAEDESYVAE
ncbi:hypothetical protein GWI33_004895 [Rhynchophorus ferrugineus]|uniref:CRAL-TRIO domain-containing protein n=1 Tax=Rhynchophorus ferrugineus TaxID=354439 RepID=A0A834II61_RHYFE|nr:hypothetical protein GWI33_004895 [Rhynchophorus ferrugineus]